jgi:hypothetical protein
MAWSVEAMSRRGRCQAASVFGISKMKEIKKKSVSGAEINMMMLLRS